MSSQVLSSAWRLYAVGGPDSCGVPKEDGALVSGVKSDLFVSEGHNDPSNAPSVWIAPPPNLSH